MPDSTRAAAARSAIRQAVPRAVWRTLAVTGLAMLLALGCAAGARSQARSYLIVSFGDSFTAGNSVGNHYPPAGCYRSYDAYPWRFRERLRAQLGWTADNWHVACSGATTANIPAQMAEVGDGRLARADVVMLTIGGNDLKFVEVAIWCIGQPFTFGECTNLLNGGLDNLDRAIGQTRTRLLEIAGKTNAHIVLVGYPRLTSPACPMTFANQTIRDVQAAYDSAQSALIAQLNTSSPVPNRFHYLPMAALFDGRGPCAQPGFWMQPAGSTTDKNEWFHPTKQGHQQMAEELFRRGVMNYPPLGGGGGGAPPPPPAGPAAVTLAQGPAAPRGFWYAVTLSGFSANTNVQVRCHDSVDPGGFGNPFTLRTNGAGAASSSSGCYSADGPEHWVVANGISSNRVRWGSGGGGNPPPPSGLPAPTGVHVNQITQTDFWINWNPVPGADSYDLYLNGSRLFTVPLAGMFSFPIAPDFPDNPCGRSYTAGVQAWAWSGDGGKRVSPIVQANVTMAPCPPPPPPPAGAPTEIRFSHIQADRFDVSWDPVPGAAGYAIYLNGVRLLSIGSTTLPMVVGGSCGTTWTVGVQTERPDGTVSGITERTVTTAACAPDTAPPALLHPIVVEPAEVDVGSSPAVVTMRIGANDGPDGSGPAGGTWTVSYGQGQSSTANLEPTGDPNVWQARVHVWQGAPTGTWSLTRVTLRDKAGNEATYSHGPYASFQVASTQPDFTIHLPAGATVQRGTRSPEMWITIRVTRGFTGTIALGARVGPGFGVVIGPPGSVDGHTCDQNGGECRIPFYFNVAADIEPRLYAFEIVGTSGALVRTEYIDVLVTP